MTSRRRDTPNHLLYQDVGRQTRAVRRSRQRPVNDDLAYRYRGRLSALAASGADKLAPTAHQSSIAKLLIGRPILGRRQLRSVHILAILVGQQVGQRDCRKIFPHTLGNITKNPLDLDAATLG